MRKLFAILLSLALLVSCAAALAEEEAAVDENVCVYTIYNVTGETVTELYLTDNATGEKSENFAGEEGLKDRDIIEIAGENHDGYEVTLSFKTESGYEASFGTLHFETVPISLLSGPSEDVITGPTPINFFVPTYTAYYYLVNQTGEKITSVKYIINETGEECEWLDEYGNPETIEADAALDTWMNCDADKTGAFELTLRFETESGYVGEFPTLHFENVTINLLKVDATSGATSISFDKHPTK